MTHPLPKPLRAGDTAYLSRDLPHTVRLPKGVKAAKALVVYRMDNLDLGKAAAPKRGKRPRGG